MTTDFKSVMHDDFPLLRIWLQQPHVRAWWGEVEHEMVLIEAHLQADDVKMYVFTIEGRPAGFIQSYDPADWPGHGFDGEAAGTRGIDLFIGEPDLVGQGHGTVVIEAFCARLFAEGAPAIVIDPDPANVRAIRAYEKAGFVAFGRFSDLEHGEMLLMRKAAA